MKCSSFKSKGIKEGRAKERSPFALPFYFKDVFVFSV
jgi:hypothetical protein